jgi:hypothetical protein
VDIRDVDILKNRFSIYRILEHIYKKAREKLFFQFFFMHIDYGKNYIDREKRLQNYWKDAGLSVNLKISKDDIRLLCLMKAIYYLY